MTKPRDLQRFEVKNTRLEASGPKCRKYKLLEGGRNDEFSQKFLREKNSLGLIGRRGINEKFRGIKEIGEMQLEIIWGQKCKK